MPPILRIPFSPAFSGPEKDSAVRVPTALLPFSPGPSREGKAPPPPPLRTTGTLRPLESYTEGGTDPNAAAFADYAALEAASGAKKIRALSRTQLQRLYRDTTLNPVAELARSAEYDPDGIIGFCFGRAMAAHLLARGLGLEPGAIGKLFIVGDLRSDPAKPEWRFHVTTVVRGKDGDWYAIDPIMHREGEAYTPLKVSQWIQAVRQGWDSWNPGGAEAKLYLTPADAVLPDITTLPEPEDGTKLNQLNFDPAAHGIAPSAAANARFGIPGGAETIYALDDAFAREYFITTGEETEARFNFIGISINGEPIPYRDYFTDLMASIKDGASAPQAGARTLSKVSKPRSGPAVPTRRHGGSFDLSRILAR